MEKLDEALVNLRQDMDDPKKQSEFYDLFLNSTFFVPILEDRDAGDPATAAKGSGGVVPLITEAEGNDYLMLFSTLERLKAWDKDVEDPKYIEVPAHIVTLSTQAPLHWAMNPGTEFSKQFHPEEIAWLREAVERCNAAAAENSGG
ncbi:MAG TPA: hypothetical protein DCZ75_08615 [Geobacter sp.]|nr:hypothetical protein [Geobacter sp.]